MVVEEGEEEEEEQEGEMEEDGKLLSATAKTANIFKKVQFSECVGLEC